MDPLHEMNGFAMSAPQLMNHQAPTQVFGAYTADGIPMNPTMNDMVFGDPSTLMDDSNEAKRRRIARVRHQWHCTIGP
jgi:hypothetical protein